MGLIQLDPSIPPFKPSNLVAQVSLNMSPVLPRLCSAGAEMNKPTIYSEGDCVLVQR